MPDSPRNLAPLESPPLRVVLIAEDPLVRGSIASMVAADPGLLIVGQDVPQTAAKQIVSVYRPEVVLWDSGWQPGAGEGWEELTQSGTPVIVLVSEAAAGRSAWAAGASGVLARDTPGERIRAALVAVGHGLSVLEPGVLGPGEEGSTRQGRHPPEPLTQREMEVLREVGRGLSNKEIASRLAVSESTIKFHVNSILGKLGAQSRTEAAMLAARAGLIPL
jgi:DNA-binding NarL/FixJ family response regulator